MPKITKEEANYAPSKGEDRCGECKWFEVEKPNACEIVEGEIRANMWCKFWADAGHRKGSRIARKNDAARKTIVKMRAKEAPDAI